jgi:hypothetical protein
VRRARSRAWGRELEALRDDVEVREPLSHRLVLDRGPSAAPALARELDEAAEAACTAARTDSDALVHERREGDVPPVADGAEPVRIRHPDVGEEDLVEGGAAVDLLDRPRLHARALHVDDEVGEALVLGRVGVGPRDDHPVAGVVGAGAPDLLAVDDPLVAVAHRGGAEAGEVRSGGGLAEELAPDLVAARHLREETLLLLLGAVRHERRTEHPVTDHEDADRGLELRFFLAPDDLLHATEALAAVFLRPREHRPAGVELLRLPRLRRGDDVACLGLALSEHSARGVVGPESTGVLLEPGAALRAELGFLRGVFEIHARLLARSGRSERFRRLVRLQLQAASCASRRRISFSRQAAGLPSARLRSFARR